MSDGFDDHPIVQHAISNYARRDARKLATILRAEPATMRKVRKSIACLAKRAVDAHRRGWIELLDVHANALQIERCRYRPAYASHSVGIEVSSGVPHLATHSITFS